MQVCGRAFRESGIESKAIRRRYIEMTYGTTDKDGNIKSPPPFADINVCTLQHTFTHPKGLLFTTQFSQIALVVTSRAAFEDMRSKGMVQLAPPLLATHWANSLLSLLFPVSCQIPLLLT
jgi:malonyl CoA-acyl carrier protein transacylase